MNPKYALPAPVLFVICAFLLNACAYGIYDDKRLIDTQASDARLVSEIKAALLKANFTEGMEISVFSFYDNVFLVGEVPKNMQSKAVSIAKSFDPRSITPHWFSKATNERNNLLLATELRSALIGAKGLSSTRIDTVVNAGRIVLLGVVHDNAERQLAIRTARRVAGVTSVTSYLMLPQMAP